MTAVQMLSKALKLPALLLPFAAAVAYGGQSGLIYLGVGPNYGGSNLLQDGDGGAFTAVLFSSIKDTKNVVTVTPTSVPSGYAASAKGVISVAQSSGYSSPGGDGTSFANGGTDVGDNPFVGDAGFETFCVENTVDFYVGNYYDYSEGLAIQQTGTSASGKNINALTAGAAWLYEQYATGKIKLTTAAQTGAFQEALWYFQGQNPDDGSIGTFYTSGMNENAYYMDVLGKMSLTQAQTCLTAGTDTYGVQVLELTGPAGSPNGLNGGAQDQLIYTGVPDGGVTAGLLAAALAALTLAFRRRRAAV